MSNSDLNPIPEVPSLVAARIDGPYLVATTEDGRTLTFAFEAESDRWDPLESTCRHASLSIL